MGNHQKVGGHWPDLLKGNVGALLTAINKEWGTLDQFIQKFNTSTAAVQGSGWGWLVGIILMFTFLFDRIHLMALLFSHSC